jgi:hypothetical protein
MEKNQYTKQHLNSRLLLLVYLLLGYISAQLHEIGHWGAAKFLGIDFLLGFNRWQILSESSKWQRLAITTAGPLMTLFLVVIGLVIVYRMKDLFSKRIGFLLVIFNSWIALIPHLMFFKWSGDETWITYYLNVPEYLVRVPLILFYFVALFLGFKKGESDFRNSKWIVALFLLPIGVMALLYAVDIFAWAEVGQGNFMFQPLFGIQTVVLAMNTLITLLFLYFLVKNKGSFAQGSISRSKV